MLVDGPFYRISNRNLKLNSRLSKEGQYILDLVEAKIGNNTDIPNKILVKYSLEEHPIYRNHSCTLCHRVDRDYSIKRRIKVLSIWNQDGKHRIHLETIDEKQALANIVEKMRDTFYHNRILCTTCKPPERK